MDRKNSLCRKTSALYPVYYIKCARPGRLVMMIESAPVEVSYVYGHTRISI